MFYELTIYWHASLDDAIILYHKALGRCAVNTQTSKFRSIYASKNNSLVILQFQDFPRQLLGMLDFQGKKKENSAV